ncbi:MAG: hypothetical protein AAF526_03900 [Pseudomonadota bacterium]
MRALDAHDRAYRKREADGPKHRVVLKVVSGTSAGGVCTGLGVMGLIKNPGDSSGEMAAPKISDEGNEDYQHSYVLEPIHDVWVDGLQLWSDSTGLLGMNDLGKSEDVQSLLDGTHLDHVAEDAIGKIEAPAAPLAYGFLAKDFDLFLTATNVQGVPYEVRFGAGNDVKDHRAHAMSQHAAVRHFRIGWLGNADIGSPWLEAWNDVGIDLPLPQGGGVLPVREDGTAWAKLYEAAIVTGAFPVGLPARPISSAPDEFGCWGDMAPGSETRGGAMTVDIHPDNLRHIKPGFGKFAEVPPAVNYAGVDGGVINNEPFEYARYALRLASRSSGREKDAYLDRNPREAKYAHRAVIMIDPFPEGPKFAELSKDGATEGSALLNALLGLFPALKNQARFKPSELVLAANEEIHSRYMIAPSRNPRDDDSPLRRAEGAEAIASGGLGGFLGFFDRRFRAHDFILGQRNCQSFLKTYFTVSADNKVLGLNGRADKKLPVITLSDDLKEEIDLPKWPLVTDADLKPLLTQATVRLGKVGDRLVREPVKGKLLKGLLGALWSVEFFWLHGLRTRIRVMLIKTVMSDLIRREQYASREEDKKAPFPPKMPELRRDVLLALLAQGTDRRTVAEIVDAMTKMGVTGHDKSKVGRELKSLVDDDKAWTGGSVFGEAKFTHIYFAPSRSGRIWAGIFG